MAYELRDEKGILKVVVSNRLAEVILDNVDGEWVSKNFKSGKSNVFVFSNDMYFGDENNPQFHMRFYIWKGDYLEKRK